MLNIKNQTIMNFICCSIFTLLLFNCDHKKSPTSQSDLKGQWMKIGNGLTDNHIQALAVCPGNPNILIASSFGGVFKSNDGGSYWSITKSEAISRDIKVLIFDPTNYNRIYAGSWGSGIYCSEDCGESWHPINNGILDRRILEIVIHPDSTHLIYAAAESQLFMSNDYGSSWKAKDWSYGNISAIAINFKIGKIFVGTGFNGIFRSDLSKDNWLTCNIGLPQTETGFYQRVNLLEISPIQPNSIYLALEGIGMFAGDSSVAKWESRSNNLGGWHYRCLIIHKSDPDFLIAGTSSGIFLSNDGGNNWENLNQGLDNTDVRALALRYDQPIIYAGTMGGGIYKYLLN